MPGAILAGSIVFGSLRGRGISRGCGKKLLTHPCPWSYGPGSYGNTLGDVTDPQGAAVVGGKVTLTMPAMGT